MSTIPVFPGQSKKNDGLFIYGAALPKPFTFVYQQKETEIVHGPSCKVGDEINVDKCTTDSVSIEARRGGGGTVVLSPGMIVTVIVGERKKSEGALVIFNRIHRALVSVLTDQGIENIEFAGISDLALNNKKILGSSLYLGNNPLYYYYQSSLMVNSDLSLIPSYLKHPPKEPDYRQNRSHEEFCTTLHKEGYTNSPRDLVSAVQKNLVRALVSEEQAEHL